MSIGLTMSCVDGKMDFPLYCQNTAEEAMFGFFDQLQAQGLSDFANFLVDGESFWGTEIAKLPDPSNPTPEEIAKIEAMSGSHDSAEVLKEAERAYAAMQDLDEGQFEYGKEGLISEFADDLLPALRKAAEKKLQIELTMA